MKKEYIKPEILVEEFISEIYMEGGSFMGSEGDKEVGEEEIGANDRRGGWGNLWD